MKKAIKLTLAVVLMMSATSLFAQKFGRINTSEIIASMPEMKQMQVDMENFGKTLNEGIEAINVEYANKLQEYQKSYNTLPEATREMKAQDLQNLITRREQYQQAAQQDYEKKYNELMAPIIEKACPMLSARKITKPISTTSKVYRCFSTVSTGFRLFFPCFPSPNNFFAASSVTIKKPCHRPQMIKVQLAPCHRPVQKNTISLLRYVFAFPFRFPPRGIYRYSRNQVEREICHLRQNS